MQSVYFPFISFQLDDEAIRVSVSMDIGEPSLDDLVIVLRLK